MTQASSSERIAKQSAHPKTKPELPPFDPALRLGLRLPRHPKYLRFAPALRMAKAPLPRLAVYSRQSLAYVHRVTKYWLTCLWPGEMQRKTA